MTKQPERRPGQDHEIVENTEGFPPWKHGAFTFEGEIERLGGFSRGLSTAPRWARFLARGLALIILVPLAIGVVLFLVGLVTN